MNVTALAGCGWTAVSNVAWINASGSGSGNGSFNYTVLSNPGGVRTGTVTVGTATFTVTQNPASCAFTLSAASRLLGAYGGASQFDLLCSAGCFWNATPSNSWVVITSATNGSGPATIRFLVRDNASTSPRIGSISVGGQSLMILQAGKGQSDCTFQISPTSAKYSAAGGNDTLQMIAAKPCAWEAVSNAGWVQFLSPTVGAGGAVINIHVDANTSPLSRATTLRIGGQVFNIKQAGN